MNQVIDRVSFDKPKKLTVTFDHSKNTIDFSHFLALWLWLGWLGIFIILIVVLPILYYISKLTFVAIISVIMISTLTSIKRSDQPKVSIY